jgi:ABC-type sugar transport system ATPase subunit
LGHPVELQSGEIVGLAGLTGSGREELLRVGLGAQRGKVSAEVRLRGAAQRRWSPRQARKVGVFFLTEERREEGILALAPALPNTLLGSEEFAARLGFRRPPREREATDRVLSDVRVSERDRARLLGLLSGGNQQKVMFSRPLLQDSNVLLLGEPTRGIDIGARAAVHGLIRDLADEGRAVLISSSDHDELVAVCDRVVVLRRGAITAELEGSQLTEAAVTEAANANPGAEGVRDESPAVNVAAG